MKTRFILTLFLGFVVYNNSFSQTVIKMKREGGVSIIPCKVNGLSLNFIFDTGASDVSISMAEATFMLKNGYLSKEDIIGSNKYLDAVGNLNVGIIINLKSIEIAGLKLYNVKASIVQNNKAPLLLGQTAIGKLGKIQLDLSLNTITILSGNDSYDFSNNTPHNQQGLNEPQLNSSYIKIGKLEVMNQDLGRMNWYDAFKACENLGNGWRFPTKYELNLLYQKKNEISGFANNYYWSSSEADTNYAWFQNINNGSQNYSIKYSTYYVRAVRAF